MMMGAWNCIHNLQWGRANSKTGPHQIQSTQPHPVII
jgi:hypothetical protein